MDVVCSFGRSIDVDGDEWIDLGLPPAPLEIQDTAHPRDVDQNGNDDEYSVQVTSKVQTKVIAEPAAISEPVPEPEPEQPHTDTKLEQSKTGEKRNQNKKNGKVTEPQKPKLPASAPISKATRSKEALMAFYLSRAKQMEAKHKKIIFPPKPVVILQDSECSPIGL